MRGRGIGEMLIAQAEKELKNRGFSSLTLAVAKGNPAKHLYDRIGFRETSFINKSL
jgi:ribosomal protein S18 acetylase RimI-like enzyme